MAKCGKFKLARSLRLQNSAAVPSWPGKRHLIIECFTPIDSQIVGHNHERHSRDEYRALTWKNFRTHRASVWPNRHIDQPSPHSCRVRMRFIVSQNQQRKKLSECRFGVLAESHTHNQFYLRTILITYYAWVLCNSRSIRSNQWPSTRHTNLKLFNSKSDFGRV